MGGPLRPFVGALGTTPRGLLVLGKTFGSRMIGTKLQLFLPLQELSALKGSLGDGWKLAGSDVNIRLASVTNLVLGVGNEELVVGGFDGKIG